MDWTDEDITRSFEEWWEAEEDLPDRCYDFMLMSFIAGFRTALEANFV